MPSNLRQSKTNAMNEILEIEINLKDSQPKIWRRVLVSKHGSFHELHYIIQFAMGWSHSHLYRFETPDGQEIGIPFPPGEWEPPNDSRKTKISAYLNQPPDSVMYEYDFGDGWQHELVVVDVHPVAVGESYPALIGGEMACPLEDSGGVWGYADMVKTFKSFKGTDEEEEWVTWTGEAFDPDAFDLGKINEAFFKNFKKVMKAWDRLAQWDSY